MAPCGFLSKAILCVLPMAGLPLVVQMVQPSDALISQGYQGYQGHGHSNKVVLRQASHHGGPRVAMVAMVRGDQLGSVVDSMNEIQNAFDQKLSYDWIFFSNDDLSDDFKELTSNLTGGAMAFYERFSVGQQSGLQQPADQGSLQFRGDVKPDHFQYDQLQYAQQLAREQRLSGYEWFWKINPGSKFPAKINADVFTALKEQGMVYGFSTTNRQANGDRHSAMHMQRFVGSDTDTSAEQHLPTGVGEVHRNVEQTRKVSPVCQDLDLYERPEDRAAHEDSKNTVRFVKSERMIMFKGEEHRSADAGTLQNGDDDDSEEVQSWVEIVRDLCTVGSSFEIGWLDLFRGPLYSTLLDIINGDPRYRLTNDDLLNPRGPSLNDCDDLDCLDLDFEDLLDVDGSYNSDYHQPQQAKHNNLAASGPILDGSTTLVNLPDREASARENDDRLRSYGVFVVLGDPAEELSAVHARWAAITDGFDRQEKKVPGLKAGRTSLFVGARKEKILGRGNTVSGVELPLLEFV